MNPLPAPSVPGDTEFQRFDAIVRKVMAFKPMPAEPPKRKQLKKPKKIGT